jgi:hypothetical protein
MHWYLVDALRDRREKCAIDFRLKHVKWRANESGSIVAEILRETQNHCFVNVDLSLTSIDFIPRP